MNTLDQLFSRFGYPSNECNEKIYLYFTRADKIGSMDKIINADKRAAEKISELLKMAELLKEYRQSLFQRSQELTAVNYHLRLLLIRQHGYRENRKYYTVSISKIFDRSDIEPETVLSERYEGKERHKAISRFEELRKLHPGIEAEKNIEKRAWER